jgi:hypothetical protein
MTRGQRDEKSGDCRHHRLFLGTAADSQEKLFWPFQRPSSGIWAQACHRSIRPSSLVGVAGYCLFGAKRAINFGTGRWMRSGPPVSPNNVFFLQLPT